MSDTTYKHTLSAIVLTHNSADLLPECLTSLAWASEIIVVDDCSTDATVEIAKKFTPKVFVRKWDNEGVHRNFAISQASSDYVFTVDSDERISEELQEEVLAHMKKGFELSGYNVNYKNFLGDYWIQYGGWYPSPKLRLYKKVLPVFREEEPHPRLLVPGPFGHLKGHVIHRVYRDFTQAIEKLDYQTDMEARKWFLENRKVGVFSMMRKAVDRFCRSYFQKKGHKDGVIGLFLAVNSGMYQFLSYAKYWELKRDAQKKS